MYIDDAALGCPLIQEPNQRAYVDWYTVWKWLKEDKIIYRWDNEISSYRISVLIPFSLGFDHC